MVAFSLSLRCGPPAAGRLAGAVVAVPDADRASALCGGVSVVLDGCWLPHGGSVPAAVRGEAQAGWFCWWLI